MLIRPRDITTSDDILTNGTVDPLISLHDSKERRTPNEKRTTRKGLARSSTSSQQRRPRQFDIWWGRGTL